ncbi:hypothetical protein LV457_05820 [Mycobacterium sp. MYCO198283]|uniref:hypothetical protein n=1 Tax=Mycobacterium sp. MYCO198283 TaxID=2883505 RepID=UPI001E320083|nr:hypothetical protein [Mycobacterium sp. MYCO198283]MCG5431809.1 hypothetical protein [Mycobacterium sp. MYCO198283]
MLSHNGAQPVVVPGPRLAVPPVPLDDIVLAAPPDPPRPSPAPLRTRLMGLVMVAAVLGTGAVFLTSGAAASRSPMTLLFPVMMLVSTVGMLAQQGRGGSTADLDGERRDYLRYLATQRDRAVEVAEAQRASLRWLHPDPATLWTFAGDRRMWERSVADSDFMSVRVGTGPQRLAARLLPPELGPVDDLEPVGAMALREFVQAHTAVPDVPISLALRDLAAVAVTGDAQAARGMLRAVVCQAAVWHSPRDLVVVAVVDRLRLPHWDWLKWLPHHQFDRAADDCGARRLMFPSLRAAESTLGDTLAGRPAFGGHSGDVPHLLVLVDAAEPGAVLGTERSVAGGGAAGVTVVEIGERCGDIASRNGIRLTVDAESLAVRTIDGAERFARPDQLSLPEAAVCARRLARYRPPAAGVTGASASAERPDWTALVDLPDPAGFDPAARWRDQPPRNRLRVPIGVTAAGAVVELDLKEAAEHGMGPHGLCVGATGSGNPVRQLVHN